MRFAVLADIHGNLPALEAVLEDCLRFGVDQYWIAGDLLSRVPFPLETMRLLQTLDAVMIRGNGDQYQIDFAADPAGMLEKPGQWGLVAWTHEQIGQEGVDFLRALPDETVISPDSLPPIYLLHARPGNNMRGMVPDHDEQVRSLFRETGLVPFGVEPTPLGQLLGTIREPLILCGHTHIPWREINNNRLVLNPGSVGTPINNDWRAQYAILEWHSDRWHVEQRAVEYDRAHVRTAYEQAGLLERYGYFARSCLASVISGQNVAWFYIQDVLRLEQSTETKARAWDIAGERFDWGRYGC